MSSDVEDESRKWVWGPYGLVEKGPQPGRCLVNTCLCGPLLVWHSVNIYLYPCIQIVLQKVCCWMLCLCCTCECWRFKDKQFPPSEESLGNFEAKGTCGPVEWKKCDEICTRGSTAGHANLFENGVDCKDIAQGALGDCWLLSALACLSEQPGAIERAFVNLGWSARGKYQVRLYDDEKKAFVCITVDDKIPCAAHEGYTDSHKPLFTKNHGNEMWVMLMEKAFAKFMGSYAKLEGGQVLWALHVITGDDVIKFDREEADTSNGKQAQWKGLEMRPAPTDDNRRKCKFFYIRDKVLSDDQFFDLLITYHGSGCVLGAGTKGKDTTRTDGRPASDDGGIVPGHAYTILDVRDVGGFKLLNLRNPWGSFEWQGAWSDKSPLWAQHPRVKLQIWPDTKDGDDGAFWMEFGDFIQHFTHVDVCVRAVGMRDLALDVHEDCRICGASCGVCGAIVGCLWGCLKYWLCCCGLYKLCCSRRSTKEFGFSKMECENRV